MALAARRILWAMGPRARRRAEASGAMRVAVLLFATACGSVALGQDKAQRSEIVGRWATQGFGSIVEFRPCAEDKAALCGRILWLWEENDASGRLRTDRHNPDSELKSRSLIGIDIVRGLRETAAGTWSGGELYNPDDGRTYTGEIHVKRGTLELRGCALRVFCQTQTWRRPEDVIKAVSAAGL
ncbi:MAG: DUF2147 domain-containing protein [Burkholderiales bacterium]|nr:DUF2147 domain-containing protein [Burkholderiales bacterium]